MDQKVFKRRVVITGIFIMGIACFFMYRLAELHFSGKIKIALKNNYEIKRGYINDKNGNLLAVTVEKKSLFADPEEIRDPSEFAKTLAPVAGLSEKFIQSKIAKNKRFVWLKRKLDDSEAGKIKNLNLRGAYLTKEYQRVYPHENLAANIVGFVDVDNNGLDGIEYKFNDILLNKKDRNIFSRETEKQSISGITLTIDKYIQYIAEKEIRQAVIQNKAAQGAAFVLEVKTGKILAYGKYPSFNPNHYSKYTNEARGSYTIVNSFEPGSTLKIIALAAILEKNPELFKKEYYCPGSITIADITVKCTKVHGRVNMTDIIQQSCNVGIMQAIKGVSKKDFYDILQRFGFGDKTEVELSGESAGLLRPVAEWSGLSKYSISIGQEISVTSLQMAAAFGAIANGGEYLYPTIIERIDEGDGVARIYAPRSRGKIISGNNAAKILQMMRTVVSGGTGELADFEYYSPAGKTGTAQKSLSKGGYTENKYTASFIGVAPLRNPDICVFVVLDEPGQAISGGSAAAPCFAQIAKRALAYRGVKLANMPAIDPVSIKPKEKKFDGQTMPDFSGLLMAESAELLIKIQNKYSVKYNLYGKGTVYRQTPKAGEKLTGKQEINLYLRDR
ncbi:MAG: penicillin-binding transpeptidase domain-containing protein [Spirochaetota bacterium]